VVDGGLVEFVRDLKQRHGGDVGVHASISVAQAPRRLAVDSARSDPKHDLTDRPSARRLSEAIYRLLTQPVGCHMVSSN
jgi:hypothetical protein